MIGYMCQCLLTSIADSQGILLSLLTDWPPAPLHNVPMGYGQQPPYHQTGSMPMNMPMPGSVAMRNTNTKGILGDHVLKRQHTKSGGFISSG